MTYLADYEVNRGRQPEIDCLKALVIIIMIFMHVFEGCTERNSVTYYVLTYLECLTGAGIFMLCMGIGARYSRHQTPKDYLRRDFELLTVGQALNLVRVSLPYLIIWWINGDSAYLSNALLIIQADILSFAGFAFMLLALLKRMRFSDGAIVLTGIIMNAFAYVLFRYFHTTGNFLVDQLLAYFIISWVDKRNLPNSIIKLKSPWNVVAITTVWLLTFAIVAYVYPKITEYATMWNNYLDY